MSGFWMGLGRAAAEEYGAVVPRRQSSRGTRKRSMLTTLERDRRNQGEQVKGAQVVPQRSTSSDDPRF